MPAINNITDVVTYNQNQDISTPSLYQTIGEYFLTYGAVQTALFSGLSYMSGMSTPKAAAIYTVAHTAILTAAAGASLYAISSTSAGVRETIGMATLLTPFVSMIPASLIAKYTGNPISKKAVFISYPVSLASIISSMILYGNYLSYKFNGKF